MSIASITIDFSDIIASCNCDISSSFNKELKNSRARFKYLGATLNDLSHCIDPTLKESKLKRQ